jgi:signal transduction histidine kinase
MFDEAAGVARSREGQKRGLGYLSASRKTRTRRCCSIVARGRPVANQGPIDGDADARDFSDVGDVATSTIAALMRLGALAGQGWEETLQEILLVTSGTLAVERVSYWRFREEPNAIVCELGYEAGGHRFERGFVLREVDAAPYFRAVKSALVMAADNAREDPRTNCLRGYLEARNVASLLDTAVRSRANPVGILCVEHVGEPRTWTAREQEFALAVAQILSTRNEAHARDEAELRVRQAHFMDDVIASLVENLEPKAAAQVAVQHAVPALADWASIITYDGTQFARAAQAHVSAIGEQVVELARRLSPHDLDGPGFITHAMRERQTLFIRELTAQIAAKYVVDDSDCAILASAPIRSLIAAPLIVRGHLTGGMLFATTTRSLNQSDLQFAERYVSRISVLLENARLYQKAQDAIRARDDFLTLAAHELRTPITSLRLSAQTIAQKASGMSPGMVALSDTILRQSARLERMADRLLDTCEIGAGRPSIERSETDLGEILDDVVQAFRGTATRAGSELLVSVRGRVVGCWDPIRLEQIVANLVDNSIKFGKGKPIHIDLESTDDTARLSIRDEGLGISDDDKPHVFDQYWRGEDARHFGGLGLGLYVVRELARAHGGDVSLESGPAGGSTFLLELPLEKPSEAERLSEVALKPERPRQPADDFPSDESEVHRKASET